MNLTSNPQTFTGPVHRSTSTQEYPLGTRAVDRLGRTYRYCQAGAVALVVGNIVQAAAVIANHVNMTPTAAAIGARQISVTPGATAGAANLYAEGTIVVSTTPGLGETYGIASHLAITASVAFALNLYGEEGLLTALTSSSRIDIRHNPYRNVIQSPVTTLTGNVVGVAVYPIEATYFGWIQTWGPCGVLIAGTPAAGLRVAAPGSVAGGVVIDPADAAVSIVGDMMTTGVDTKAKHVFLKIAP